ncbi:helix-turn-helix transcriptional regulator [Flavobacterium sp. MC2016-06]|uniref:helix-turn-helix transcriptional regulator n=1 Tax=Flavobacterium sp. MC2016-06 TaxID=2676308 RepID=UPI0012BAA19D|nr:response regulator transcription factor [Flavobacterium sp. MC2016-06]MBU3861138.1 helix-turn-helix transcriptional regulator [Flavobacterium sp. MC2016-06]
MKSIKVPADLTKPPFNQRALEVDGCSVIESCVHTTRSKGAMFLEDHLLLFVLQGENTLTYGNSKFTVRKNEMILFPKASLIDYDKSGDALNENVYDSLMIFLKDECILSFMKMAEIKSSKTTEKVTIMVKPVKERIQAFLMSLKPYFNEIENIDAGLVKLKILEVLYDISSTDKHILQQLLQMKQPVKFDLSSIMEENYTSPISLPELAYLSGRSLATFKRDFKTIYNIAPSDWIRNRRLEKAMELLQHSVLPVSDICYTLGFENTTHFSRIFKEHFGQTPSDARISYV